MTPAAAQDEKSQPARVSYHCVCGATAELDVRTGGRCAECGRRYSAEVARVAGSETIRMPPQPEEPVPTEVVLEPPIDAARRVGPGDDAATMIAAEPPRGEVVLPADRRLGHFRVVGWLGRGGMGDVYRALDESLQRYVALKILRPGSDGSTASSGGPLRLLQEARAQARVNHPGVVHIYYVSPDPERPFLAMELVAGPTLADRLKQGPLPYGETVDVALQIVRALRHAVRYDVVHGDIKPGNILLTGDGGVKLSDFGLARRLSGRREGQASTGGSITGTPNYLPPEVVAGAEPDVRSDLYALGVMLFEMTFGRRPYTVETGKLVDQIEAHRSAAPEFPDPWPVELPEGWRGVLARLLAKEPDDRYQTHDELLVDLERLKPVDLPRAGRVNRGLAWVTDLFLAGAAGGLLLAPLVFLASRGMIPESPVVDAAAVAAASALVLLGATWLQATWKSSPGKSLFQLRVVDRHGLTPRRGVFAARVPFQLLPLWGEDARSILDGLGAEALSMLALTAVLATALADAAVAFVRRDGRSLHDLLLRTRVVLDTRPTGESS